MMLVSYCNAEVDFEDAAAAILQQSFKPPDARLVCVREHLENLQHM